MPMPSRVLAPCRVVLLAAISALLLASTGTGTAVAGTEVHAVPLSQALTSKGTLKQGAQGSFNATGYKLTTGPGGAPRFVKPSSASSTTTATTVSPFTASATSDNLWSDSFGVPGVPNASAVYAVAVSGANVYIGGTFTYLSADAHIQVNNVAMWNGHGWHALGAGATNGVNAPVHAIALSGSNVYVGGEFTSAGGSSANYVAMWNGTSWNALASGMGVTSGTPRVYALAVSGSKLYAGGTFDTAGGVAVHSIAAWDGTNWSAIGGGVYSCTSFSTPNHCSTATPPSGRVNVLLVSGSNLYVGGNFNYVAGTEIDSLALWNGTTWASVAGSGVRNASGPGSVNALTFGGTTLYIAGQFDHVNGVAAASVASLSGTTWHPLGTGVQSCSGCVTATVDSLAYWGGRLYIGGNFSGAGGDGVPQIAQWTGTTWSSVGPGLDGGNTAVPWAMAVSSAGVVVGGGFPSSGSAAVRLNYTALWNGSKWSSFGLGVSNNTSGGQIFSLAASNHNLYAGGSFAYAGWTATSNLAHFNGTAWDNMGGGVSGGTASPWAIAVNGSQVFVAGNFTQAGSVAATNIAMWDGSAWHTVGSGTDGQVNALLVYNGKLYVGGSFSHAGGVSVSNLATWDLTAHTWAPVGGNLHYDGTVSALAGVPSPRNHYVVIGGDFPTVDSGAVTVNSVVMFDTTASITGPLSGYFTFSSPGQTPGVTDSSNSYGHVGALASDGTNVYVGGRFDDAGAIASRSFAAYSLANGTWSSPGVVGGGASSVSAITQVGSSFYIAGDFTTAGTVTSPNIAQYTPSTATWSALGDGLSTGAPFATANASSLAQSADGLYVGGKFGLAGLKASQTIGLWTATAFPLKVSQTVTPTSVVADSQATYTSTVTNLASTPASGVKLNGSISANAAFVSETPSQGTCTLSGRSLTCALGSMAAGTKATVAITVQPIQPGTTNSIVSVSETGSPYTNSATTGLSVAGQSGYAYVGVSDSGFSPATTVLPGPGRTVQFDFYGPGQHSVKDGSPLAMFDSGLKSPYTFAANLYSAAGTYPVLDASSTHTATVEVADRLSVGSIAHGSAVNVTGASTAGPPSGWVFDYQVLLPGATTWTTFAAGSAASVVPYTPATAGTYQFRSRLRNSTSGAAVTFSQPVNLTAT